MIGTLTSSATLTVNGNISASSFTGSVLGTSSWSTTAITASFLPVATYSITSSWATNALTASYVTASKIVGTVASSSYAFTASYFTLPSTITASFTGSLTGSLLGTSSWSNNSVSSSYAKTSSYALSSSYSLTASSLDSSYSYSGSNNGYTTLPGGIIIQWGNASASLNTSNGNGFSMYTGSVTFPKQFTSAVYSITCTPIYTSDVVGLTRYSDAISVTSSSLSDFNVWANNAYNYTAPVVYYWNAIGK